MKSRIEFAQCMASMMSRALHVHDVQLAQLLVWPITAWWLAEKDCIASRPRDSWFKCTILGTGNPKHRRAGLRVGIQILILDFVIEACAPWLHYINAPFRSSEFI